jgi:tRNA nucleotidyltransferase (CCA-adding enzyme)
MNIAARLTELLPAEAQKLLHDIGRLADREGQEVFLVGGMVRDVIMGRGTVDFDLVVNGDGPAFAQALAETTGGAIVMHDRFGTSVLILPDKRRVDVATARTETYPEAGALPDVVYSVIDYDLKRRDFSVNSIAMSLTGDDFGLVLDPFDGQADIERKTIKVLHDASFTDDPTRIFRAVRFEQRFGFQIDNPTAELLRAAIEGGFLKKVSAARVRNEIAALFEENDPAAAVTRLNAFGVWDALDQDLKVTPASIRIVRDTSAAAKRLEPWLGPGYRVFYSYLMGLASGADVGGVFNLADYLGLSRHRRREMATAIEGREAAGKLLRADPAPSALWQEMERFSDAALVFIAADGDDAVAAGIERFCSLRTIKPLITGQNLVKLGYRPSADFKGVLRLVWLAQLDGTVKTGAEASALAARLLDASK